MAACNVDRTINTDVLVVGGGGAAGRRVDHAAQVLGTGRAKYVHPDCGMWLLPRSVADAKLRALVKGGVRVAAVGVQYV